MSRCEHGVEELCAAGAELYERALRTGQVEAQEAADTPCLTDFGLLHPALDDPDRLEPVAPAAALNRLLRSARGRIAAERRREERLVDLFAPLMGADGPRGVSPDIPTISVLSGLDRIGEVITQAMIATSGELLAVQPHTTNMVAQAPSKMHVEALARDQALLDRGGRIRTLYQHPLRHSPTVIARYEQIHGDVEARTLDEVTARLIVIDRTVAFLPASKDRTVALEIRHPALVRYLATTFDRLWDLATPMYPEPARRPTVNGITPRQQAIAALLVEGHTDAAIADRLGMNIRTARVHIANLADTLGSGSRAQLGYLIARAGILDQEG
ncbi:LuxR C-terminal-related transcriptional regulator [Streptomyces sp. NPDC090493]|uniref:LuxR C-terminal-related transcriptional regulator n=1 Tax=Streptomyces sp. NPDC090493 TaxID=3365964 RepID=UPI00381D21F7